MKTLLAVAKAISDPSRLRVVCLLRGRELCACDIVGVLGLAQATVSRHMSVLVQAGLVVGRKQGRWMYYRLPQKNDYPSSEVKEALKWIHVHAAGTEQITADERWLGKRINGECEISRK